MRLYFLSILICFIFHSSLFANSNYSVQEIQLSKEQPISEISKIYFGQQGLLWIGTNNGLYYFDGYNFSSQESVYLKPNSLLDDNIIDIAQDNDGNIWLSTSFGLEFFNVSTATSEPILELGDNIASDVIFYSPNNPFLYFSVNEALLRLETKTRKVDTIISNQKINRGSVLAFNGFLWFIEEGYLIKVNEKTNVVDRYTINTLGINQSTILKPLDSDRVLLAIDNSLYCFNSEEEELKKLQEFTQNIVDVSTIKGNEIGIATVNDLYFGVLSDSSNLNITHISSLDSLEIKNIIIDKDEIVWLATSHSILKFNTHSNVFHYQPFLPKRLSFPTDEYLVFEAGKSGLVYKGNNNEYYYFNTNSNTHLKLSINNCKAACEFQGNLYLGLLDKIIAVNLKTKAVSEVGTNIRVNSFRVSDNQLLIAAKEGVFVYDESVLSNINKSPNALEVFKINEDIYSFTNEGLEKVSSADTGVDLLFETESVKANLRINEVFQSSGGEVFIATKGGLYRFNPEKTDLLEIFETIYSGDVFSLIEDVNRKEIWYSTNSGIGVYSYKDDESFFLSEDDGVISTSYFRKGAFYSSDSILNFASRKQVLSFNPAEVYRRNFTNTVVISKATFISKEELETQLFYKSDTLVLDPDIRSLELELSTFDYYSPDNTKYEYSLEPIGSKVEWREVRKLNVLSIGALTPGEYELKIKATNSHGVESLKYRNLILIVKEPILQSRLAYLFYFISLIFVVILLIQFRTRNLRRINREYKKRELIAKEVELQKEQLSLKNKNITDSINYARRIQLAMMPSTKLFSKIFPDSFVLHMPKDIVSGDFYWMNEVEGRVFFSAVDCTGHGVPGAFMSIIGVELFRRITEIEKISTPSEVLNSLSKNFDRVFADVDEMKLRDGMDLAFCSINKDNTELEYAGAFNPLYIVRDSSILEIKGDRYSVGVYEEDDDVRTFNNHIVPLKDGDIIYIFTDGFADQFGGPDGKKYKYRRFRHLLLALHQLPLSKQKEFLKSSILEWKGDLDQVDDILVMGLRINQKK